MSRARTPPEAELVRRLALLGRDDFELATFLVEEEGIRAFVRSDDNLVAFRGNYWAHRASRAREIWRRFGGVNPEVRDAYVARILADEGLCDWAAVIRDGDFSKVIG